MTPVSTARNASVILDTRIHGPFTAREHGSVYRASVTLTSPVSIERGGRMPSWYATSHSGQLSLLPSAGRKMSIRRLVLVSILCGWEGNRRSCIAEAMLHRLVRSAR